MTTPDNKQTEGKRTYWCFISYRHRDNQEDGRQWASWLHHSLETYDVPTDLIGTTNERGEIIPERIFPVFRDEEELSTGDLTQRINEALENSQVLVVICSPLAVVSDHVVEEIRYFKALHPRDHKELVHAAMIYGDPDPEASGEEGCFPESLKFEVVNGKLDRSLPVQPKAANFRLPDNRQGWTTPEAYRRTLPEHDKSLTDKEINERVSAYRTQLDESLLILISGILGVSYGRLKRRDKAYQLKQERIRVGKLRRWLSLVSGLFIGLVILGGISYWLYKEGLAAGRTAAANQEVDLAIAEFDQDPLGSLKRLLTSLSVLKKEDEENLAIALSRTEELLMTGRLARLGDNVRAIYPMADGNSMLLWHAKGLAELIGTNELENRWSYTNALNVSAPWGPDLSWRSIIGGEGSTIVDLRDGRIGLHPFEKPVEIILPPDSNLWAPLMSFNRPGAVCSQAFSVCYVTSTNDGDEWAAVDRWVDRVDFITGENERIEEVYEVLSNGNFQLPCQIARENEGWYLTTAKEKTFIGDSYDVDKYGFSPQGEFAWFELDDWDIVRSCKDGEQLLNLPRDMQTRELTFSYNDRHLLTTSEKGCKVLGTHDFGVIANLEQCVQPGTPVSQVPGIPKTWKLERESGTELITLAGDALIRHLSSVDPGLRIAKVAGRPGSFLDLESGALIDVNNARHHFIDDPEADYFVTMHAVEDEFSDEEVIERVVFRDTTNIENERWAKEISLPDDYESDIFFRQTEHFAYLSNYIRGIPDDPPFNDSFTFETDLFDVKTGTHIDLLQFVVDSHQLSPDPDKAFTLLTGSSEGRNDRYALLDNSRKKIVWQTDYSSGSIDAIHLSDLQDGRYFVVGYERETGAVHRVEDGEKIADLTDSVTRVQFLHHERDYLAVWYRSGLSELWELHANSAILLTRLGQVVDSIDGMYGTDKLVVRHLDGRAYLIDAEWLSRIRSENLTLTRLVRSLSDEALGPAGTTWWNDVQPRNDR